MSFNWFSKIESAVNISVNGTGMDALTIKGQEFYNSSAQFGIECGENYITSYKEGSLLLMGVVIEFETMYDKNLFKSITDAAKTNFTDVVSLTQQV